MIMRKVTLRELSGDVQSFLAQIRPGEGMVVQDEAGRVRYEVIPYAEATAGAKAKAWKRLERLQRKVGKSMKTAGVDESDVERLLLEDD
jgi:hypothetical protein